MLIFNILGLFHNFKAQRYEFYTDSRCLILKKIGSYHFLYRLPEKSIMISFKLKFHLSAMYS